MVGPGGGGGWAGGGDGEGQFFFTHLSNFFVHFLHFFLLPASTPVARRSEMRSMIMSFIVWALCVPARAKAMAHDRTRAGGGFGWYRKTGDRGLCGTKCSSEAGYRRGGFGWYRKTGDGGL